MSRNQFRLLVVINQLLLLATVLAQEVSDKSLPPELKSYLGIDQSVLNVPDASLTSFADVPFWLLTLAGLVAAVGLYFGKRWGRTLFLLTCVAALVMTLLNDVHISTGWTSAVSYLVSITDGMILGLAYFSNVRRMFHDPENA